MSGQGGAQLPGTPVSLSHLEEVASILGQALIDYVRNGGPTAPDGSSSFEDLLQISQPMVELVMGNSPSGVASQVLGPLYGTLVDRSGTIAAPNTSQALIAANAARNEFWVQNPISESEPLYVNPFGNAAVVGGVGSISVSPGQMLRWVIPGVMPVTAMTIIAATMGHVFTAGEA